ncbi:MAG: group III truncated hemoglobin [Bacteroidetes bacterium]|nr:group III truncated hemoglobin [Bacteroidota bacterium]
MKKDLSNREDIEILINAFYDKVKTDPIIGHFFTSVVEVNWEKHLPVMYDFWESILFQKSNYSGNPMAKHQEIHNKYPLKMEDFQHWIALFTETVDENFEGNNAETAKQRGMSIATVMQIKILSPL